MILTKLLTVTFLSSFIMTSALANFNNEFDREFVFVQERLQTTHVENHKQDKSDSKRTKGNTRVYTWDLRR